MGAMGKAGITVELGGNCRTLTRDFQNIADDLAAGYLNVMRHYGMISGAAQYEEEWRMGYQIPLLAPATGMYVGVADLPFETELEAGTLIGEIYNLYGDVIGRSARASKWRRIWHARPASVIEGHWCCFFGVVEDTVTNLIPH